jgi:hypothetical protein
MGLVTTDPASGVIKITSLAALLMTDDDSEEDEELLAVPPPLVPRQPERTRAAVRTMKESEGVRMARYYDKLSLSATSMKKTSHHPVARLLGGAYAHLQHGIDQLIEWSVTKMKQAEPDVIEVETPSTKKRNPYLRSAEKVVRGTFGFIGTLAESYFTKYRQLKAQETKNGNK